MIKNNEDFQVSADILIGFFNVKKFKRCSK